MVGQHCFSEEVVLHLNLEPRQLEEHGGPSRQSVGILGAVTVYVIGSLTSQNMSYMLKTFEEVSVTEFL